MLTKTQLKQIAEVMKEEVDCQEVEIEADSKISYGITLTDHSEKIKVSVAKRDFSIFGIEILVKYGIAITIVERAIKFCNKIESYLKLKKKLGF